MSGAEPRLAAVHGQNPERRQTTRQQRENWAPACEPGRYQRVDLHGEGRVTVDKRIVPAVEALSAVLEAHGYETRRADTGGYNCRPITGGTGYSLHAFGICVDINWSTNPYGKRLVTDMPRAMVDDILAITTNSGARVWEWGGDWKPNRDAMHFEIDCTPADLATGLRATDNEEALTVAERDDIIAALAGIRAEVAELKKAVVGSKDSKGRSRIDRMAEDSGATRAALGRIESDGVKVKKG